MKNVFAPIRRRQCRSRLEPDVEAAIVGEVQLRTRFEYGRGDADGEVGYRVRKSGRHAANTRLRCRV